MAPQAPFPGMLRAMDSQVTVTTLYFYVEKKQNQASQCVKQDRFPWNPDHCRRRIISRWERPISPWLQEPWFLVPTHSQQLCGFTRSY